MLKKILNFQRKKATFSHAYLVRTAIDIEDLLKVFGVKKPDLFLIEENPIKISHIRELIHWASLKPHSSPRKLAIISGAENMTLEAANAILKILEEPPDHSILVLTASKFDKILPTILSRCQVIKEQPTFLEGLPDCPTVEEISKMSVKERFDLAKKLSQSENLAKILDLWEKGLREKLLEGKDSRKILERISQVRGLLSTNISVRLLLENLLLEF